MAKTYRSCCVREDHRCHIKVLVTCCDTDSSPTLMDSDNPNVQLVTSMKDAENEGKNVRSSKVMQGYS